MNDGEILAIIDLKWNGNLAIYQYSPSFLGGIELVAASFVTSPSRTLLKKYPANDYCNENRRRPFLLIGARKKKHTRLMIVV